MTRVTAPPVFLPWRRLPHPVDWAAAFGRSAPLHLEVGFGDGRYTARRALDEPDDLFVGLEVSSVSMLRAVARMRRLQVGNVRLLKAPAEVALRRVFAPATLRTITVNFPDPWPKEKHEDHRLLRVPFFQLAATRLLPGGEIRLASDHLPYVEFARAQALASGVAALIDRPLPAEVARTKYAVKWLGQGKPLYYQVFALGGVAADSPPTLREVEMPHALLTGGLPDRLEFTKIVAATPEGHVIVHDAARVAGPGERLWFRVTVDEAEMTQQLLVLAARREGGEVIVRLESFGDPLITPAVRAAIGVVTDHLIAVHGLQATARNY
jgi:tRNA (guanine-N7-)-methyltransferase